MSRAASLAISTPQSATTWRSSEIRQLIKAANIVTHGRTGVERDYKGDVVDAHSPEMLPFRQTAGPAVARRAGDRHAARSGHAARVALRTR